MNSSTPVFAVEARPNRATRRFALSRRRQRKGQALILAVLVMLMVAVLSAGFLVVVSGNLNQTARVTDKTRAVESARSGLKFVNDQLTYSALGEKWRPGFLANPADTDRTTRLLAQGESLIPAANDPSRSIYYSPVDIARGWAGSFAKFPDPLAPRSDAPQYLARVQRIPDELDLGDPDLTATSTQTNKVASDTSKQGMLRLTVIGLSNDDPAAFHQTVAYKGGSSAPFGRFMRTVTNWDFKNNIVPVANVGSYDATAKTITLNDAQGSFPAAPFTVMIGNATVGQPLRGAVVRDISTDGKILTLATAPTDVPAVGERVELAGQLGASLPIGITNAKSAIDFNLNNVIDTGEEMPLAVSSGTTPGSAFVNGGAYLLGGVDALNLQGQGQATQLPSNIQVTGLAAREGTADAVIIGGTTRSGGTVAKPLVANSNVDTFPLGTKDDPNDLSLVTDGFARLSNSGGSERQVAPATPPNIASGAQATRYRQLANARDNAGNQSGVYINNPTDRERINDGGTLREMTQAELVKMWLSRTNNTTGKIIEDTTVDFCRKGTPAAVTATNASLEQQHLRGWVGADEFRARGALVELINEATDPTQPANPITNPIVAKVAVTLDSRSDNAGTVTTNASGPVLTKAWKDATTGATQPGVYRKVFAWPTNGVIFAEGNVRVRGTVTSPAAPNDIKNSLTIVSQNNIYIDGSVGVNVPAGQPARKVLLLARKNVVANPTQAIFRPDAQTLATDTTTLTAVGTPVNVSVSNATDFQVGDVVETSTTAAPATIKTVAFVQAIVDATTVTLSPLQTGTIDDGDVVRTTVDNAVNGRPVIAKATDAIQRRLQVSNATDLRLAFYHNADRVTAATIETEDAGGFTKPGTQFVYLSNKKVTPPTTTIAPTDKKVLGEYSQPTTGSDPFPATPHSTDDDANAYDLTALKNAMEAASHVNNPTGWKYKVTLVAGVPATTPAHYLAGFGNRYDFGINVPAATPEFRKDISTDKYDVPVATSISSFLTNATLTNSSPVALTAFDTPATATTYAFGFSPVYTPATALEDISTNDQGFYQGTTTAGIPDAVAQNATLDSRLVNGAVAGTNSLVLRTSPGLVAGVTLPTYRSGNMKLESVNPTTSEVKPAYTMNINAFVYAQTGSWFVIPAAPVDPLVQDVLKLRGEAGKSYFDNNTDGVADAGEYVDADTSGTFTDGDCADLNRNAQADPGEAQAFLRYSRANYQVNFTGAIAENQTAIVNSVIDTTTPTQSVIGAVQAWSNDWANYTANAGALTNPLPGVTYTFDPTYANNPFAVDDGFVVPQSDQLLYVE